MNLLEQINNTDSNGLTIRLDAKDIMYMSITWNPSWVDYNVEKICQASITFSKDNIESKVNLQAQTLPELFAKIQQFLLSL